jgi:hypothetical protein
LQDNKAEIDMSVAFLFPGQGSQVPGMLHTLPDHPSIERTLDENSRTTSSKSCFTSSGFETSPCAANALPPRSAISDTTRSAPSLLANNALLAVLLLWTLAFNLLQLFVYRRLGRCRRPKDSTDTIRHIVAVMLRDVATLREPIPWAALLLDTS